ncbi:MAG: hypothetical protein ACK5HY_16715 [Parahaliea sp.]
MPGWLHASHHRPLGATGFTKVDANVTYTSADQKWQLMLYFKNLTDKEVPTQLYEVSAAGNVGQENYLPLRQYGVRLSYRWP